MIRSELIDAMSQRFPQLTAKDAEVAVAEILGAIAETLATGGRVEIRGFGSFALNYRSKPKDRCQSSGARKIHPSFQGRKRAKGSG